MSDIDFLLVITIAGCCKVFSDIDFLFVITIAKFNVLKVEIGMRKKGNKR